MQPKGFMLDGQKVLMSQAIVNGVALVSPTGLWVGLIGGLSVRSNLQNAEVSGPGYARVSVPPTSANWTVDTHGKITNAVKISFPTPTGAWSQAWAVGVWSVATGGLPIYSMDLLLPKTFTTGDAPNFAAGALIYQP